MVLSSSRARTARDGGHPCVGGRGPFASVAASGSESTGVRPTRRSQVVLLARRCSQGCVYAPHVARVRVGLTGGIASGKSLVAEELAARGAVIIDADVLAREVVEPGTDGLAAVVERFGAGVLTAGRLDRARLGQIVFADPEARRDLERIVHPAVRARAAELERSAPSDAVVVHVIPLLVETGQQDRFDVVVVVDVDPADPAGPDRRPGRSLPRPRPGPAGGADVAGAAPSGGRHRDRQRGKCDRPQSPDRAALAVPDLCWRPELTYSLGGTPRSQQPGRQGPRSRRLGVGMPTLSGRPSRGRALLPHLWAGPALLGSRPA